MIDVRLETDTVFPPSPARYASPLRKRLALGFASWMLRLDILRRGHLRLKRPALRFESRFGPGLAVGFRVGGFAHGRHR